MTECQWRYPFRHPIEVLTTRQTFAEVLAASSRVAPNKFPTRVETATETANLTSKPFEVKRLRYLISSCDACVQDGIGRQICRADITRCQSEDFKCRPLSCKQGLRGKDTSLQVITTPEVAKPSIGPQLRKAFFEKPPQASFPSINLKLIRQGTRSHT